MHRQLTPKGRQAAAKEARSR